MDFEKKGLVEDLPMSLKQLKELVQQGKLVLPDYENCIANLPNSVLKKFGLETVGSSLPLADQYMVKKYKNIVVLLLDGMGTHILEKHLEKDGFFRSHLKGTYKSTFLSTTVSATTSALSGLQPCEHSWLGWDCYYPQVDQNVTVFLNTIQGTETQVADYNVPWTVTPYENVAARMNRQGKTGYIVAPFIEPYPQSLEEICSKVKTLCDQPEEKYIYAYWNEPDGLLHRHGCDSDIVHNAMIEMEATVKDLFESLDDTLLLITADHGHLDTEATIITDHPKIMDCLERMPSLEPRVLNLFVKEEQKECFETEFQKEFGEKFVLLTTEEALELNLWGTRIPHKEFRSMLGNYIAIATGNLSIFNDEEVWLSMHGSLTPEEMLIPLIVLEG